MLDCTVFDVLMYILWQCSLGHPLQWQDMPGDLQLQLEQKLISGDTFFVMQYTEWDFIAGEPQERLFEVDLCSMTQRNLKTGRLRKYRRLEMWVHHTYLFYLINYILYNCIKYYISGSVDINTVTLTALPAKMLN